MLFSDPSFLAVDALTGALAKNEYLYAQSATSDQVNAAFNKLGSVKKW